MVSAKTDFRIVFLVSLCLIIAIIIPYRQVVNFDFVGYDDALYVTDSLNVQNGFTVKGVKWAFATFHSANWHPITWLSHMLDCELYGLNPMGHHWTNLQFHIANTLLLFFILQYMTGALWKSAFVAALFALHPLHVESVAWIAERKDVLSAFFGLLSIAAYCRYVENPRIVNYLLIILLLGLGLMAKPMLVTIPFVFLLLDLWPLNRLKFHKNACANAVEFFGFKAILQLVWEKIPLFVLVTIVSVLTFIAQQSEGAVKALEALSLKTRIANALISYVIYIAKAIWPINLAVFYPYPKDLQMWKAAGAGLLLLGAFFLVFRTMKTKPYLFVGWLWYIGTLVPVIGLIQVGEQAMADRYTYIPLVGLFIIFAWGVSDLFTKWQYRKIFIGVSATIILTALTANTYQQLMHWQNGITLFENAIKVTENNYQAHNNLGTALDPLDLDGAISHYKEALKIKPDFATAFYNIGNPLAKQGLINEAIDHYLEALRIKPNYAEAHNNLGTALTKKGNYDEAILHFKKALKINSQLIEARNNLANLLFLQGKPDEAIFHYNEILKSNPEYVDAHYNLAYVLSFQEKLDEAVLHFKKAITIKPEYAKAHYHLGKILMNQKKIKEAMFHFAETIRISPDYAEAYNKIGIILAEQGKYNKAKVFFSKAVQIKPSYTDAQKNIALLKRILSSSEK
ncbi:MAG: tetratricopeptide repeat protein [Deltaproteobacteria bacterium]|nr:tetratricopeptide repeat protein [Deltaproteobacteria bacterium]MBW2662729.1 tetratricopeptide repeat protein [Deltaproteobacteria bacterium]